MKWVIGFFLFGFTFFCHSNELVQIPPGKVYGSLVDLVVELQDNVSCGAEKTLITTSKGKAFDRVVQHQSRKAPINQYLLQFSILCQSPQGLELYRFGLNYKLQDNLKIMYLGLSAAELMNRYD